MGHIIYNNLIAQASVSKSDLIGTVTISGDISSIKSRSPVDNISLTGASTGDKYRITVDMGSSVTSKCVAFLGFKGVGVVNPELWTGS